MSIIIALSEKTLPCRDGAATARKQSAKAFSNSGCYAEVPGTGEVVVISWKGKP